MSDKQKQSIKAVILAGGKGTRLHPYTIAFPKPLMPIGDMPILEILLKQLKNAGIQDIGLAVGHMKQLIQAFFETGERYDLRLQYSYEEFPLGTAGAISLFINDLDEDFYVLNGDLLTTLDFKKMMRFHREANAAATIAVCRREVYVDFGVIEKDNEGLLDAYIEKPTHKFLVSMGINIFNREEARPFVKPNQKLDIPQLMLALKEAGRKVVCFDDNPFWLDIGRVDDYHSASEIFDKRRSEFLRPQS